jgi:hypothetical protein
LLWGENLRRRAALARERGHIHQLIVEAERRAGSVDATAATSAVGQGTDR